jgi:hypothetical protein
MYKTKTEKNERKAKGDIWREKRKCDREMMTKEGGKS